MIPIDKAIADATKETLARAKQSVLPDPEAAAASVIGSLSQPIRNHMAYLYLARMVRDELRAEAHASSRRAARRGRDSDPQLEADLLAVEKEHYETMQSGVSAILTDYASTLKVEWTKDLLESTFALGNGAYVVFGEASVEEHQQKLAIYMANVMGNLESAALHIKAIGELRLAEANSLNEAFG